MSFLGLSSLNGDFGGETDTPNGMSPSGVAGIDFGPLISDNGTAPTPSNPGSGGSFLNELGIFSGIFTSGLSSVIKASNPSPVIIPRTTNLPASSLQRLTGTGTGSSVILWVLIALAVVIGIKFLRK